MSSIKHQQVEKENGAEGIGDSQKPLSNNGIAMV